jgi:hypothetical protein
MTRRCDPDFLAENSCPIQRNLHFALTHGHSTSPEREHCPRRPPTSRELALRVRSIFLMSLEIAPRYFASGQTELSVRFATLAKIFSEIVNINECIAAEALCITRISQEEKIFLFNLGAANNVRRSIRRGRCSRHQPKQKPRHFCRGFAFPGSPEWLELRSPCRPCRRPGACRPPEHSSSAVRRSWLRW